MLKGKNFLIVAWSILIKKDAKPQSADEIFLSECLLNHDTMAGKD